MKNIILDIDGVLADFCQAIIIEANKRDIGHFFPSSPNDVDNWNMSSKFTELFKELSVDDNFWLNIPVLNRIPEGLIPKAYLTARPCKSLVTEAWLAQNGYPKVEVITVKQPLDKIDVLLELKPDIFVDDHIWTIAEARKNGINALLFDQPYQVGHNEQEGLPKIYSLEEIK